jgi:hypothetical protein
MRLLSTIFLLLSIAINLSAFDLQPYFKDFDLGLTLNRVQALLRDYQVQLEEEKKKPFRMDIPVFLYLSFLEKKEEKLKLDLEKKRIYLDDVHFFDFQEKILRVEAYDFYYEEPYYYMVFKDIVNYPVDYPSRINVHLTSLNFKFYKGILYSIEYRSRLEPYQIARLQKNYYEKYGFTVNRRDNSFSTETGMYFIQINPEQKEVRVNLTSRKIYELIEKTIESNILEVLNTLVREIEDKLNLSGDLSKLLLQERKKVLKEKIREIYQSIDEL